jgi:hypothetical protein
MFTLYSTCYLPHELFATSDTPLEIWMDERHAVQMQDILSALPLCTNSLPPLEKTFSYDHR